MPMYLYCVHVSKSIHCEHMMKSAPENPQKCYQFSQVLNVCMFFFQFDYIAGLHHPLSLTSLQENPASPQILKNAYENQLSVNKIHKCCLSVLDSKTIQELFMKLFDEFPIFLKINSNFL